MPKIVLIFALLFCALTVGQARVSKSPDCTAPIPTPAQFEDPNLFFLCSEDSMPVLSKCLPGKGFLDNTKVLGCVPWPDWECLQPAPKPDCSVPANAGKTLKHEDPNKYWTCPAAGSTPAEPEEKECAPGTGFDPTATPAGCVEWKDWKVDC